MRMRHITKRNGSHRIVAVPTAAEKAESLGFVPQLNDLYYAIAKHDVVHGFLPLRSPVTNAMCHVGYRYSLCLDLEDFFGSVRAISYSGVIANTPIMSRVLWWCLENQVLPAQQGLPHSPMAANIAFSKYDNALVELATAMGARYTRYADDLTFSFDDCDWQHLARQVEFMIGPFKVNRSKTHLQCADAGLRHITGVAVGQDGIRPTRQSKRRLRAARHNAATGHVKASDYPAIQLKRAERRQSRTSEWMQRWLDARADGLAEWCNLKTPNTGYRSLDTISLHYDDSYVLQALATRTSNDNKLRTSL